VKKIILGLFITSFYTGLHAQEVAQQAFSEGVKLLKSNKFIEAEKQFSVAIDKGENPKGLKMSYIYKGFALNGQLRYDSAISSFNKAIQLDSLDPASFTDRGLAYSYKKDYDHATKDFNQVLKLDSSGAQAQTAYYYLGRIKMSQYKDQDAIKYFDKLLALASTDAEGYFLRGTAKSNIMDIKSSIADFDFAIKYKPDYMEAYANRGVQKINLLPVKEKIGKKIDCLDDPCADFIKAKELGDTTVDDMIYLYCKKCK
jgi:tetratricopeptide (TPR) repeat protein